MSEETKDAYKNIILTTLAIIINVFYFLWIGLNTKIILIINMGLVICIIIMIIEIIKEKRTIVKGDDEQ